MSQFINDLRAKLVADIESREKAAKLHTARHEPNNALAFQARANELREVLDYVERQVTK